MKYINLMGNSKFSIKFVQLIFPICVPLAFYLIFLRSQNFVVKFLIIFPVRIFLEKQPVKNIDPDYHVDADDNNILDLHEKNSLGAYI